MKIAISHGIAGAFLLLTTSLAATTYHPGHILAIAVIAAAAVYVIMSTGWMYLIWQRMEAKDKREDELTAQLLESLKDRGAESLKQRDDEQKELVFHFGRMLQEIREKLDEQCR